MLWTYQKQCVSLDVLGIPEGSRTDLKTLEAPEGEVFLGFAVKISRVSEAFGGMEGAETFVSRIVW